MSKQSRKAAVRLEARIRLWREMVARLKPEETKGFRKPGSLSGKK